MACPFLQTRGPTTAPLIVTMTWKGGGRMVDLTFRSDNGYDVSSLAVVCFLPDGSATMRILRLLR